MSWVLKNVDQVYGTDGPSVPPNGVAPLPPPGAVPPGVETSPAIPPAKNAGEALPEPVKPKVPDPLPPIPVPKPPKPEPVAPAGGFTPAKGIVMPEVPNL
jgi:hypothetical protein